MLGLPHNRHHQLSFKERSASESDPDLTSELISKQQTVTPCFLFSALKLHLMEANDLPDESILNSCLGKKKDSDASEQEDMFWHETTAMMDKNKAEELATNLCLKRRLM